MLTHSWMKISDVPLIILHVVTRTWTQNIEIFVPRTPPHCVTYWCASCRRMLCPSGHTTNTSPWNHKTNFPTAQMSRPTNNTLTSITRIALSISTKRYWPTDSAYLRLTRHYLKISMPDQNYTYNYRESLCVQNFTVLFLKHGLPKVSWQRATPVIVG